MSRMKKLAFLLLMIAFVLPVHAADDEKIRAAALDYAEGWYEANPARMTRALHPDLAKRIVSPDGTLKNMTAAQLVEATGKGYGRNTPADKQLKEVRILDQFGNAAVVRLEMAGWIDYLELGRFGDEWKIVNVLWERKPKG
jgi:hypothetical protein